MSNTLGLLILALGIGLIVTIAVCAQYLAQNAPDTKLGRIAKAVDDFISQLPDG